MTCTHEWKDSTTPAGPEWFCVKCKALYSETKKAPPAKRGWIGLTDEEIKQAWDETPKILNPHVYFYCLVEAKLKEKNEM